MAHLHRLILRLVVLVVTISGTASAFASFPATSTPKLGYTAVNRLGSKLSGDTADAACAAAAASDYNSTSSCGTWSGTFTRTAPDPSTTSQGTVTIGTCKQSSGSCTATTQSEFASVVGTTYSCPANATLSGSTCTCDAGFVEQNGQCATLQQAQCSALTGKPAGSWERDLGKTYTSSGDAHYSCNGWATDPGYGCLMSDTDTIGYQDSSGEWWQQYTSTYTGATCDPTAQGTGTASSPYGQGPSTSGTGGTGEGGKDPCPTGQVPGTVNGQPFCYTPSTTQGGTVTGTVTGSSPDGTSTTSTTGSMKCKDGTCTGTLTTTVTTTTIDGSGNTSTATATGTWSGSMDKAAYCKTQPTDPQCGDSSGFSGSCSAGFQCSGDAVMCATAKGVWEQKCALVEGPSTDPPEKGAVAAAIAASGASGLGTDTVAISGGDFDTSNALGVSAQCVTDLTVTVWGHQETIALTKVCPWLETLGTIMLALAYLAAALIVGKGIQGS